MTVSKEEFIAWATNRGWKIDRFGHLTKEGVEGRIYRYKIGTHSVRREIKCVHDASQYSPRSSSWVRLASAYFKDLSFSKEGKLRGMKW